MFPPKKSYNTSNYNYGKKEGDGSSTEVKN
jgi:hypothetical protein